MTWGRGWLRTGPHPARASPRWGMKPLTCANASLAKQPRQALHPVKGVEVVDVLVQAVHPVLMLRQRRP